jgi:hypothetical protein
MSTIAELDKKLNDAILSGKALEIFEELYDETVVMQENLDDPCVGKVANRKREQDFFGSIETIHRLELLSSAINGDVTFAEWAIEVSIKGVGRVPFFQVAVRHWKDGKVVHERFYHK